MEQVGAQTETELKEKKLRVEDALNATKVQRKEYGVFYLFLDFGDWHYVTPIFGCFRQLLKKE